MDHNVCDTVQRCAIEDTEVAVKMGYKSLAAAVVLQAILDYKEIERKIKIATKNQPRSRLMNRLKEIEGFFLSRTCDLYTGVENAGKIILSRMDEIDTASFFAR